MSATKPDGPLAVVVGNERKGISRQLLRRADHVVQIPIASRTINTINVAAAAAVALYYLSRGRSGRIGTRAHSGSRPEVLLAGAIDAIELGSAVRTAACLGWTRLFVRDRGSAWFAADRVTRSLGRGAARRARNPIRVLPLPGDTRFDDVCVVSARGDGTPLHRADLARGPRQLVVIPDETAGDAVSSAMGGRELGGLRAVGFAGTATERFGDGQRQSLVSGRSGSYYFFQASGWLDGRRTVAERDLASSFTFASALGAHIKAVLTDETELCTAEGVSC